MLAYAGVITDVCYLVLLLLLLLLLLLVYLCWHKHKRIEPSHHVGFAEFICIRCHGDKEKNETD